MASQVDLQALLEGATAESLRRQADTNTNFLAMMDRVFLRDAVEPTVIEAAASRQLLNRESPIEPAGP